MCRLILLVGAEAVEEELHVRQHCADHLRMGNSVSRIARTHKQAAVDRPADKLRIRTADGHEVEIFFDVSEYFGRS
jgi:hypothetical protein